VRSAEWRALSPGTPRRRWPARCSLLRGVRELPLYEGENLLEREPEAVVRLVSEKASRRHARIVVNEHDAVLEDLGSKNGTRVREPVALEPGDRVEIGRELLVFLPGVGGHHPERRRLTRSDPTRHARERDSHGAKL
jgi:hypothetical protein